MRPLQLIRLEFRGDMIAKYRRDRSSDTLRCGGAEPHIGLREVSLDALANRIGDTQIHLCADLTLPGRQQKPFDRLVTVTRQAVAVEIHQADVTFRYGISPSR